MMVLEQLRSILVKDDAYLYCVLDGGAVPELPMRLYEFDVPHFCLMSGDLEPDMLYVAPFMAHVDGSSAFSEWIFENVTGGHWGIFVHTRSSIIEMRRHLGALLTVYTEDGDPMIFRYYDPRVIGRFLRTCNAGELKTFFGRIDAVYADAGDGKGLVRFTIENEALKEFVMR